MAPNCPGGSWGGMMGAPASSLSQEAKAVVEAIENLKKAVFPRYQSLYNLWILHWGFRCISSDSIYA